MDELAAPQNEAPSAPPPPHARGGTRANPPWLTALLPVAISLFSLVLSLYTVIEANREPEVWLSAPDVVRVASGDRAWFYVQPRLVSAAANNRVAVVNGLRLEVISPSGEPASFTWDEQGTWQYDPVNRGLDWIYLADPAPLVVSPNSPQLPICLFIGPPGWNWQAGTYQVRISAGRDRDAEALQSAFALTLPAKDVEQLNAQPGLWIEARTSAA